LSWIDSFGADSAETVVTALMLAGAADSITVMVLLGIVNPCLKATTSNKGKQRKAVPLSKRPGSISYRYENLNSQEWTLRGVAIQIV
jgi:hypothetical protein